MNTGLILLCVFCTVVVLVLFAEGCRIWNNMRVA